MPVQVRNSEMVDLLAADLQRRYEPQFAWKSACSSFLALSGLRGLWPTSSFNESGTMYDLSGQGRTLTYQGDPQYRPQQLFPTVLLDGTGDYFSRADEGGLDITGTESYVTINYRGVTLGGWYRFANAAGSAEYMLSKWDVAGNERSYALHRRTTGVIRFQVSTDGTAVVNVATTGAPAQDEWFFAAGRYAYDAVTPEMDVWYNDEQVNNAVGVPASLHSGTADFNMGARHNGNDLMTGRLSLQFLCATALPDAIVGQLFQQTRAMFGV